MYNRYIPQSDGSYQRSRVQEQRSEPNRTPANQTPKQIPPDIPMAIPYHTEEEQIPGRPKGGSSVDGFLRQLLPKDFDTGDLLVVLLLLLMAGEKKEDHNTALLTLALYLFM